MKAKYFCPLCGSTSIQFLHWYDPVTGTVHERYVDPHMFHPDYCEDCDQRIKAVEIHEEVECSS